MLLSHTLSAALLIAMPIVSIMELRELRSSRNSTQKRSAYVRLHLLLWSLMALAIYEYGFGGLFYSRHGSVFQHAPKLAIVLVASLIAIQTLLPFALAWHRPSREAMRESYHSRQFMLPVTGKEQLLYASSAVTIGISEELLYRAFLPQYILALPLGFSAMQAYLLAAVLFGLGHFLQGLTGIIQSLAAGLLFGFLYGATGSLLLPIVLHVAYNMRLVFVSRYIAGNR